MKSILSRFGLILVLFAGQACNAQETQGIRWMSFEEAVRLNDKAPKKIFIDVYTGWCGWCKRMDASTFKDSAIVNYMNQHYYSVKLDAETRDTLHFRDKAFVYRAEYKANELALSLLNGKMGYPSFVIMDEQYAILTPLSGFHTTEQLTPYLTYFATNTYKTTKWEEYAK